MTKKKDAVPAAIPDGVDIDRIKKLMGPPPDEKGLPETTTANEPIEAIPPQTAKPIEPNAEVAAAAEEANATLKAMSPDLGEATITRIDDALLDDLETINQPEAGAAPADGEGLAGDDPHVEKAVDDIVSNEGDALLEAEDEKRDGDEVSTKKSKHSFREFLGAIWAKPAARWGIIVGSVLLVLGLALLPMSRYFALNTVGVRASLNVTVIDSGTLQPLKNVQVKVANASVQTDGDGIAKLEHLKLGKANLEISKRAFATVSQKVTVGWGSNPEGQFRLVASGDQYSFVVTDFLSGKPIEKAEASSGEGNALSDKNGKIVLSLDTSAKKDSDELDIKITATNYRAEAVKITAGNKETNSVKMVSDRKDVFISKRSGKYDIYTIDIDGKNEQKIVSGTGLEREDMALSVQQSNTMAAYVATRENVRNSDGYLLSTLYLVDTKSGSISKVDQSEQIQLIGWASDGHLVYVKIAAGASAANAKRHRLMSLNSKNVSDNKEIASANAFNDVLMVGDKIVYAPSNALQDNPKPGLFVVNADNTNSVTVTTKEAYNVFRTDYSTLTLSTPDGFFTYKVGAAPSTMTSTKETASANRFYVDSAVGNRSLWLDNRDGKGVVLSFDKTTQKDTVLTTQSGIKLPLFWLNDSNVIFRINDGKQTADYVVSINGGDAKKIQDVSDTAGVGRWYYY
jgi:hypothetical protein